MRSRSRSNVGKLSSMSDMSPTTAVAALFLRAFASLICDSMAPTSAKQRHTAAIDMSLTEAVLNWSPSCFATAARRLNQCKIHVVFFLVINLVPFLSYCFLNSPSLATLCSCKTVHHAVYIEPRQLRIIFKTLFVILR